MVKTFLRKGVPAFLREALCGANSKTTQTRILPIYTPVASDDEAAPPAYTSAHTKPQTTSNPEDATVEIHPLPDNEGLIIKVEPPKAPRDEKLSHVPCDIVLVIDVSGSMSAEARIPGGSEEESTGLSVLDLVKHACRTVLSTLNEGDRLAIITFSNRAREIQPLTAMTDGNKETAEANIEKMYVQGATNLWAGLKLGIEALNGQGNSGRVPAVMVLTDGQPNHMCPPGGYVPALRAMGNIVPTIHTFGFGFDLRSGLLKSIAEFGRGNYAFIPDTGMIGTTFVHAVAHLQSTFATNAELHLRYPEHIALEQTAGCSVDQRQPEVDGQENRLTIPLGNLQYGQSRDIHLRWMSSVEKVEKHADESAIQATLDYGLVKESRKHTSKQTRCLTASSESLTSAETAYHISRHQILEFLASLFPLDPLGEHRSCIPSSPKPPSGWPSTAPADNEKNQNKAPAPEPEPNPAALTQKQAALTTLIATLPAAAHPTDPQCASLLQDLTSPTPYGQIALALSQPAYFARWGQHYLPSLHGAHARQLCNSFKDPGPLQYGIASPLFIACRGALNAAFDELPPPAPSIMPMPAGGAFHARPYGGTQPDGGDLMRSRAFIGMPGGRLYLAPVSMRSYNKPELPCFAARTMVALAGGRHVRIATLKRGMKVETPMGPRKIAAVVMTPVKRVEMVKLEGVLVTPWHPVLLPGRPMAEHGGCEWVFPCRASHEKVKYTGCIYSILLEEDAAVDAHAIMLGSEDDSSTPFWGVTLGHGMLRGADSRAHCFFGDLKLVIRSLKGLEARRGGRFVSGGTRSSEETGLVCEFKPYCGPASAGQGRLLGGLRRVHVAWRK